MANIKKAGIEFIPTIDLNPDETGKESTFTVKYRNNSTGVETDVSSTVSELASSAGTYQFPVTVADAGDYTMLISSTIPGFKNIVSAFVVVNASMDDIKAAIDNAQTDITSIKSQVDTLDEAAMNSLVDKIDAANTKLGELEVIINDDGNDAIVSLRELLNDISSNGSGIATLEGYKNDLANMLTGEEFLSDGTTSNPLYNMGLDEIHGKVDTLLADVQTAVTDAKDSIEGNMATFKTSVEGKVDDVKAVVDANAVTLGDASSGLVKAVNDVLAELADGGNTEVRFDSIDSAIADMQTAVMDKLTTMDGKLDSIGATTTSGTIHI